MPTKINVWREKWLHDCFDTNFTLVMRVPPLDEKTNTILEYALYYLEKSKKLMPGGHDNEDTDEEEESDWLEEDGLL